MDNNTLPTQIATSLEADFETNTWTFLMPEGYTVAAGKFAILDLEVYNNLKSEIATAFDEGRKAEKMKTGTTGKLYARIEF